VEKKNFYIYKCVRGGVEVLSMRLFCFRKGTPLKASEVRNIITDYVKKNELIHETNKK